MRLLPKSAMARGGCQRRKCTALGQLHSIKHVLSCYWGPKMLPRTASKPSMVDGLPGRWEPVFWYGAPGMVARLTREARSTVTWQMHSKP